MTSTHEDGAAPQALVAVHLGTKSLVASASAGGTVQVWNTETGERLATITAHRGEDVALALTLDETEIATSSRLDPLRIWNATTGELRVTCQFNQGKHATSTTIIPAPDGEFLYSGSATALSINSWRLATGKIRSVKLAVSDSTVTALTLAADGQHLYSGSSTGVVALWESQYSEPSDGFDTYRTGPIVAIAVPPEADEILTLGEHDRTVCAWHTRHHRLLHTFNEEAPAATAFALAPGGEDLFIGCADGTLQIWNRPRRELLTTLRGHDGAVQAVSVRGDGVRYASAGTDGVVQLWNRSASEPILSLSSAG